jgi:hypothetical protein
MNTTDNNNNQPRPDLMKIVEDIIGLRQLTATTGFMTFKEIKIILERLCSEDKSLVGIELAKREQKQQPIYERTK